MWVWIELNLDLALQFKSFKIRLSLNIISKRKPFGNQLLYKKLPDLSLAKV